MPDRLADQYADDFLRLHSLFEPQFVKVQDGFYDRKIVRDSPLIARFAEHTDLNDVTVMEWHYEPCHEPRYKTELRWEIS